MRVRAVAAVALWGWMRSPVRELRPVMRWATVFPRSYGPPSVALSPDSSHLACIADAASGSFFDGPLYVRGLDQFEAKPVAGDDQVSFGEFFFSPDGKWNVYRARDKLKKVPATGGAASPFVYLPPSGRSPRVHEIDILEAIATSLIFKAEVDVAAHTLVCEFKLTSTDWKVYENLRTRDGEITFLSAAGARVLTKSAEASFAEAAAPYLGLSLKDVVMSPRDLPADRLLEGGQDPDPERVRSAAPPLGSI